MLFNLHIFQGIPYADSFYVLLHYCMARTVDNSTVMSVHAQVKYKKSVWGVIKGFIEKNTWLGLEEFYESLSKALMVEYCIPPAKAKGRRSRKGSSIPLQLTSSSQPILPGSHHDKNDVKQTILPTNVHTTSQALSLKETGQKTRNKKQETLSWIVIVLLITLIGFNVILYIKLWKIDDHHDDDFLFNKLEFLK